MEGWAGVGSLQGGDKGDMKTAPTETTSPRASLGGSSFLRKQECRVSGGVGSSSHHPLEGREGDMKLRHDPYGNNQR